MTAEPTNSLLRRLPNRPLVCGIVNVTPDSFSDGGKFIEPEIAIAHGLSLAQEGADVLDIGGQSTRPGADPVGEAVECSRVLPVIAGIRQQSDIAISIDTMKPKIAQKAMKVGANIWNDVSALRHELLSVQSAAELQCPVILMHMQGQPKTMQHSPHYTDVVAQVIEFLQQRISLAKQAGICASNLWVDPGIGFGKSVKDNLVLLANLKRIGEETSCPVMLGASRKRFIAALDPTVKTDQRLGGSLAAVALATSQSVAMVRVHDVRQTVQMLRVLQAVSDLETEDE